MTDKVDIAGFDDGDPRLAVAEYVLGTLDQPERERIARAIETDPALAAEARFWENHFSGFNQFYEAVTPPAGLLARTEARLFATEASRSSTGWFGSLAFWRTATGLALAAAIVGIGLNILPLTQPQIAPQTLVAMLEPAEGQLSAVAVYDREGSALRILATGAPAAEGQDYELWLIPADGIPLSVSLLTVNEQQTLALEGTLGTAFAEGVTLAVSLEPQGGSPTGAPTGPVLAAGISTAI